jgi:hypothetical protein
LMLKIKKGGEAEWNPARRRMINPCSSVMCVCVCVCVYIYIYIYIISSIHTTSIQARRPSSRRDPRPSTRARSRRGAGFSAGGSTATASWASGARSSRTAQRAWRLGRVRRARRRRGDSKGSHPLVHGCRCATHCPGACHGGGHGPRPPLPSLPPSLSDFECVRVRDFLD